MMSKKNSDEPSDGSEQRRLSNNPKQLIELLDNAPHVQTLFHKFESENFVVQITEAMQRSPEDAELQYCSLRCLNWFAHGLGQMSNQLHESRRYKKSEMEHENNSKFVNAMIEAVQAAVSTPCTYVSKAALLPGASVPAIVAAIKNHGYKDPQIAEEGFDVLGNMMSALKIVATRFFVCEESLELLVALMTRHASFVGVQRAALFATYWLIKQCPDSRSFCARMRITETVQRNATDDPLVRHYVAMIRRTLAPFMMV